MVDATRHSAKARMCRSVGVRKLVSKAESKVARFFVRDEVKFRGSESHGLWGCSWFQILDCLLYLLRMAGECFRFLLGSQVFLLVG